MRRPFHAVHLRLQRGPRSFEGQRVSWLRLTFPHGITCEVIAPDRESALALGSAYAAAFCFALRVP